MAKTGEGRTPLGVRPILVIIKQLQSLGTASASFSASAWLLSVSVSARPARGLSVPRVGQQSFPSPNHLLPVARIHRPRSAGFSLLPVLIRSPLFNFVTQRNNQQTTTLWQKDKNCGLERPESIFCLNSAWYVNHVERRIISRLIVSVQLVTGTIAWILRNECRIITNRKGKETFKCYVPVVMP